MFGFSFKFCSFLAKLLFFMTNRIFLFLAPKFRGQTKGRLIIKKKKTVKRERKKATIKETKSFLSHSFFKSFLFLFYEVVCAKRRANLKYDHQKRKNRREQATKQKEDSLSFLGKTCSKGMSTVTCNLFLYHRQ